MSKALSTQLAAQANEAFFTFLDQQVLMARSASERLAVSPPQQVAVPALAGDRHSIATRFYFDAMLLKPDEQPPRGWTVYED